MPFNSKLRETKNLPKGKTQKTFTINHSDFQDITIADIKRLSKRFEDKGDKFRIRALNSMQWFTLQGMNSDLQLDEYEDYYNNRVRDAKKFEKFFQLEVVIIK